MKEREGYRETLLREIAKCRACRFCVDVCPTYQASTGVETLTAFGRLQTLSHLVRGTLDLDDALAYALYSCLQCRRCEVICKSKGQNLEICKLMDLGRSLLAEPLVEGSSDERI